MIEDYSIGRRHDAYVGCLLGLAVGDALGAPAEPLSLVEIRHHYGRDGIQEMEPWRGFPAGSYTDDTQMSVATAVGLIHAFHRYAQDAEVDELVMVHRQYLAWLETQGDPRHRRGPGRTCLTALASGRRGTIERPINDSKGCGGVMRTAPAGLAFPVELAFQKGAEVAALTHGHASGYLSAGFLAELVARLASAEELSAAARATCDSLASYEGHGETLGKVLEGMESAASTVADGDAIEQIGEGWIGEEALGIALFCALRHAGDFATAVKAAVNHSGDSDSTGSICGAIAGTYLGVDAIPDRWRSEVEESEYLERLGGDLYRVFARGETLEVGRYPLE